MFIKKMLSAFVLLPSFCLATDPYERAIKIVNQMTMDEKFSLIQGAGHTASGNSSYVGVIKGMSCCLFFVLFIYVPLFAFPVEVFPRLLFNCIFFLLFFWLYTLFSMLPHV